MKLRRFFLLMAVPALLAACMTLAPAPQFVQELGKQYKELSFSDGSRFTWDKVQYFKQKSERVLKGADVQPEDPVTWNVPPEYLPEITNAYDTLRIALVVDEKKVTNPIPAARAQAYYDCWVERAHKKWVDNGRMGQCRAAFYEAICQMYKRGSCPVADDIHRVFFDLGSARIDAEGHKAVAAAVKAFKSAKKGDVVVAGHADKVGNAEANLKLSKDRAEAVKAKLVAGGIPASKISVKYFGESQPLVPTGKDVPNRQNRRVLIVVR